MSGGETLRRGVEWSGVEGNGVQCTGVEECVSDDWVHHCSGSTSVKVSGQCAVCSVQCAACCVQYIGLCAEHCAMCSLQSAVSRA